MKEELKQQAVSSADIEGELSAIEMEESFPVSTADDTERLVIHESYPLYITNEVKYTFYYIKHINHKYYLYLQGRIPFAQRPGHLTLRNVARPDDSVMVIEENSPSIIIFEEIIQIDD